MMEYRTVWIPSREQFFEMLEQVRNLKFGDEVEITQESWELTTWMSERPGAGHIPVRYMYVQLDNDFLHKHFYTGDIQSAEEFEYKIARFISRVASITP